MPEQECIIPKVLITFVFSLFLFGAFAQEKDSILQNTQVSDSLNLIPKDSVASTVYFPYKIDSTFQDEVNYDADDSLIFDYDKGIVYLYGNAQVTYQKIKLKADYISFNFKNNNVVAAGIPDTSGNVAGKPEFADGDQVYNADTIKYNFETKKGIIKDVGTAIADGHVYGETVKKTEDDIMYIKKAEYCPCEDKDAKTRIRVNKLKVIPNEKIVSGPWNLRIGKIPTPLGFFLGYFPNNEAESAGILIPQYGESDQLGFYLINGGWYQPLGKKADLQLTGDIYSKGSWGGKSVFRYNNRYNYNGNLSFTYNNLKNGIKGLDSYTEQKTSRLIWSHRQDPKARPNSNFSANVNIGSSESYRNTINTNIDNFVTNTFQSNIAYSKSFPGKPYSLALSASHNQNTQTKTFNFTLPTATFNLSRVNLPLSFLKSKSNNKTMWYEKIGFNMSSEASNRLTVQESELKFDNLNTLLKQSKNGIRHNANLSTNLKAWYFTITPSARFTDRMYFDQLSQYYDPARDQHVIDTISKFSNVYNYSFSTSFTTKLYGMYSFKKGPIKAIRHVMIPSASLNYTPEFNYTVDKNINDSLVNYNPFAQGIYGTPNNIETGGLSLSLQNNVEMKMSRKNEEGEPELKKVKLIESFNLTSNYNQFADSLRWSNISSNFRTTLFKQLSITANAIFDPYAVNMTTGANYEDSYYNQTGKIVRLTNGNAALSYRFVLNDYWKSVDKEIFGFTANANLNYTVNRSISNGEMINNETNSFTVRGDLSFLKKFRVSYYTGYDFQLKQATTSKIDLYIDLNCWEARIGYVPTGFLKSVQFSINMKSAILKDVKLERRRNLSDEAKLF